MAGAIRKVSVNGVNLEVDEGSLLVHNDAISSSVILSLDTSAYATGDVLADTQVISNAVRAVNAMGLLQTVILNDKDDQGMGLDLIFLDGNVSLGTENAAPSITDANADKILGVVSIVSGDWIDLGGTRVAVKSNIGLLLKPASGTADIYVAAISRGTGTYTAAGITGRFLVT